MLPFIHPRSMLTYPAPTLLTAVIAAALIVCGAARAAAPVGETRLVAVQPAAAPPLDQLKESYRRPDTIPFPPDNPYTPEKALLGRILYNDTRLSASGATACASCHNPGFDYGNGLTRGIGNGMKTLGRRSPSVIDSAWGDLFMWDGSAASLEDQALDPIESSVEMNQPRGRLIQILSAITGYRPLFAAAFPNQAMTPTTIAGALATYERTIVSGIAPFDAWIDGDKSAIPEAAKRGFAVFNGKGQCASCHAGWVFTDDGFHDIGLPDADLGRGRLFPRVVAMQHAFKTPSLRETARRGPYMHDGSLPTLAAVVAHYNQGGVDRPSRSELVGPLGLSPEQQADLVAFLDTLTSSVPPDFVPALPR
jgi:cytochrome c peroxidase